MKEQKNIGITTRRLSYLNKSPVPKMGNYCPCVIFFQVQSSARALDPISNFAGLFASLFLHQHFPLVDFLKQKEIAHSHYRKVYRGVAQPRTQK